MRQEHEEYTLLHETIKYLEFDGKTPEDVRWVGSQDGKYAITWEEFEEISRFGYDSGYGAQEIATDLVVVGDDWWMDRHEYDGSEHWDFHTLPIKQPDAVQFTRVCYRQRSDDYYGGWESIDELNSPEHDEEDENAAD